MPICSVRKALLRLKALLDKPSPIRVYQVNLLTSLHNAASQIEQEKLKKLNWAAYI